MPQRDEKKPSISYAYSKSTPGEFAEWVFQPGWSSLASQTRSPGHTWRGDLCRCGWQLFCMGSAPQLLASPRWTNFGRYRRGRACPAPRSDFLIRKELWMALFLMKNENSPCASFRFCQKKVPNQFPIFVMKYAYRSGNLRVDVRRWSSTGLTWCDRVWRPEPRRQSRVGTVRDRQLVVRRVAAVCQKRRTSRPLAWSAGCPSLYKYCNWVFRNYYLPDLMCSNVSFMPLGFGRGVLPAKERSNEDKNTLGGLLERQKNPHGYWWLRRYLVFSLITFIVRMVLIHLKHWTLSNTLN